MGVLQGHLAGPEPNYDFVSLRLEVLGASFDEVAGKEDWVDSIPEAVRGIYAPLVKALCKPGFSKGMWFHQPVSLPHMLIVVKGIGFRGVEVCDRAPDILAAAAALGALSPDETAATVQPNRKAISRVVRDSMTVDKGWDYYPEIVSIAHGQAKLFRNEGALEDGSYGYSKFTCPNRSRTRADRARQQRVTALLDLNLDRSSWCFPAP